jgi:glutamyl/glutaminyl-tRNA synthetase
MRPSSSGCAPRASSTRAAARARKSPIRCAPHERHTTLAYPGTCRTGLHGKPARAWRLRVPDGADAIIRFDDRWQHEQQQNLATEVGDFVLKRADGQWAYQLAVVVDDADARITHVVRGADLLDSTARQIYLQRCLGVPTPAYLHVPVVVAANGEKLSKQTGALALERDDPLPALRAAAAPRPRRRRRVGGRHARVVLRGRNRCVGTAFRAAKRVMHSVSAARCA